MHYNRFISFALCSLFFVNICAADVAPKYELALGAGNYYTINKLFPHQRFSSSISLGLTRFFGQINGVELQFQRGEFQYQIRGINTSVRGVNSISTDLNIAVKWKYMLQYKNRSQLHSGIGFAFTRHRYREPGYKVYEHEWSSQDVWIMTDPTNYEKKRMELSIPLSVEWKYHLKPRVHLNAAIQHYLQPARIYGFGYGTGISIGLGYLF